MILILTKEWMDCGDRWECLYRNIARGNIYREKNVGLVRGIDE